MSYSKILIVVDVENTEIDELKNALEATKRKMSNKRMTKAFMKGVRLAHILKSVRWPGIEPGSNAWKASMLTITPPTLVDGHR